MKRSGQGRQAYRLAFRQRRTDLFQVLEEGLVMYGGDEGLTVPFGGNFQEQARFLKMTLYHVSPTPVR